MKRAKFDAERFRVLALSFEGAVESEHMNHPDFRVGGKIFATIAPGAARGMVKLDGDQQISFVARDGKTFVPISGEWGKGGATWVVFAAANETIVREALAVAHENVRAKRRKK
jgi:YjbR